MTSVAVVVLDTLRYDAFRDHFGYLDGTRFTSAYSTSHWTGAAHASLLTGQYPSELGTTIKSRGLPEEADLLTEQLSAGGYTTQIVSNNPHIYQWPGWQRGFSQRIGTGRTDIDPAPDRALDWRGVDLDRTGPAKYLEAVWRALRSDRSTATSLRYGYRLKRRGSLTSLAAVHNRVRSMEFGDREFLLCNVMDTHVPYEPPPGYRSGPQRVKPDIEEAIAGSVDAPADAVQAYDDCARCLADQYRALHADLRDAFDYVITMSDHGELLGEGGLWTHDYGLRPELVHVPLVVSGSEIPSRSVDTPVSLLDVHRTVADLAGVDVDSRGQNLLGEPTPRPRLVEYHGLPEKRRETFREYGIGDRYDPLDEPLDGVVTAEGYAHQTHDDGVRCETAVDPEDAMNRLDSIVGTLDRKPIRADETEPSAEVRDRLRELGYV